MPLNFSLRNCNQSSPIVSWTGRSECTGIWGCDTQTVADAARGPPRPSLAPFNHLGMWLLRLWVTCVSKVVNCYSLWENALRFSDSFTCMWREPPFLEVSLSLSCPEPGVTGRGGCKSCFHASSGDKFKYIFYCSVPLQDQGKLFQDQASSSSLSHS